MGSRQSTGVRRQVLDVYKIGKVKTSKTEGAVTYDLYIRPGVDIFWLAPHEVLRIRDNVVGNNWVAISGNIVGVKITDRQQSDWIQNDIAVYEITFLYYHQKSKILTNHWLYFENQVDYNTARHNLDEINISHRDAKQRNLWVLVNPISGNKRSVKYYNKILKPMLDFWNIEHSMFKTDSPVFITNFIEECRHKEIDFTEFIIIGGDGLFSQLINAIHQHPEDDLIKTMPIGLIPGGSTNSLCCGLGGKDPFIAAINIVRGAVVKGDMFSWDIIKDGQTDTIYATTMTYGFPCDVVVNSEKLRSTLGQYRYVATAARKLLCAIKVPRYESSIDFGNQDRQQTNHNTEHVESRENILEEKECCKQQENKPPEQSNQQAMSSRKIMNNWEKKIDEKYHNLEDTLDNEPVEVIANKNFNNEEFFFYTILTHEAASSVEYQWYAPFTRINDGEVYLIGVHKLNKTELSKFTWMLNKGIHYKHQKVTIEKASEFKIKNPPGTQFWLDGEIYQSDELIIRSMPGALSLLGTVTRFPKLMDEFRQSISC